MKKITEHIQSIPLFNNLNNQHYDELAMIVVDQEYRKGTSIFAEGDIANGFYIVIKGRVKIYKLSFDGKEQTLHILGAGEPFAEVAVFTGSTYPANATTLEDSRLFFFPRREFTNLIAREPSLALNMLAELSLRLKQFTHLIEALSLKEVPGRLAAYILFESNQNTSNKTINLTISKSQLASLLGTIPETLSRILTKMSKLGLMEIEGANIRIIDREGIKALAEGEIKL